MLPYKSMILIDKSSTQAVYLQICHGLIQYIQNGVIKPGTKLPGTRSLAKLLVVHRKTMVRAVEELEAQGWVEIVPYKGVFVLEELPKESTRRLDNNEQGKKMPVQQAGFTLAPRPFLSVPTVNKHTLAFTDGYPDVRLAPINELATAYARYLRHPSPKEVLEYADARGPEELRQAIANDFNISRGLHINADNIMITRGSQMAIYLAAQTILRAKDKIVIGETNYFSANLCFQTIGAELIRIPVDEQGISVLHLEELCKKGTKIKAVYITPHHHHPTSVALSPDRRLRLLDLAVSYRFAIIEDDYDFDYHYNNSPILPLASADHHGVVVYIGSYSKSTAPAFRVGYVIAATEVITELVKYRRFVDRQGDTVLELAVANLLDNGTLLRYRKKALKKYKTRRDLFCEILDQDFNQYLTFQKPEGGMAAWVKFDPTIPLAKLSEACNAKDLLLSDGQRYDPPQKKLNATRMGFAALDEGEIERALKLLKKVIEGRKWKK